MREYIGFGAGAHSYYDGFRYCNVDSIEEYIKLVKENNKPLNENEKVNEDGLYEETIMLGLRTKYGINLDEIKTNFGKDLLKDKNEIILDMLNNKLIKIENNNLIATDLGFTVLNKVILELI
jgi:oxygen-independent coproporphyrinogen-3 oxidase